MKILKQDFVESFNPFKEQIQSHFFYTSALMQKSCVFLTDNNELFYYSSQTVTSSSSHILIFKWKISSKGDFNLL